MPFDCRKLITLKGGIALTALKRFVKSLFYVPKYAKVTDKSLSRMIISSVLGIMLCGVCLAGLSWAWFSSSVTGATDNIITADFTAEVTFSQNGVAFEPLTENGGYTLTGGIYTVTVSAGGSASTGYCKVKLELTGGAVNTYHTIQLYPAGGDGKPQSVEFTVNASDGAFLAISPQWGTFANSQNESLISGAPDGLNTIPATLTATDFNIDLAEDLPENTAETDATETPTDAEQSYTVQNGDTLYDIAVQYGTTVAALSAYNNITNPALIEAGTTLKIPPAGYTVPETTAAQQTPDSAATETPATETPVAETPATGTPVAETPASETPVAETPAAETQTDQIPDQSSSETPSTPTSPEL